MQNKGPLHISRFQNVRLDHDLYGNEFAHQLAILTMQWGATEYWLYNTLYALDQKKTPEWMALFFATTVLQRRVDAVKKEVENAISISYPKLLKHFTDCLDDFADIRVRRNIVAHGIWVKGNPKDGFEVQPLKFDKATTTLEPSVIIDFEYLGDLNEKIDRLLQTFGWIDAELLAHGHMEKIRARRRKFGMPEN